MAFVDLTQRVFNCFNPFSDEFKEAEVIFHDLVSWKQALVVSACVVGGLFLIVGAFPVFRWTVKALDPLENEQLRRVEDLYEKHVPKKSEAVDPRAQNDRAQNLERHAIGQTCEAFKLDPVVVRNRQRQGMKIFFMGDVFEARDRKLLQIVQEYLLYGLYSFTRINTLVMPLEQENSRLRDGQVDFEIKEQMRALNREPHDDCFVFGFTNQFLYSIEEDHLMIGDESKRKAVNILSLKNLYAQHGDENVAFNKTLVRFMKLAAYQLGVTKGIHDCVRNRCAMQEFMSIEELDRMPLAFCPTDMGKVCHLTGRTLKEGYESHLQCLERLSIGHGLVGFDQEIEEDLNHLREILR